MSRAIVILLAMTLWPAQLHPEEAPRLSWVPSVLPKNPATPRVLLAEDEPYCELGNGPCGGQCTEEGGKKWACAADTLPCYQRGRCTCEVATVCKPKKKK